jgi:CRP-like cAMP-binding protein
MTVSIARPLRRPDSVNPVLQRLTALQPLKGEEVGRIEALCAARVSAPAGVRLVADAPQPAKFLLSGWAAYSMSLPDGRRQILRLLLPGDTFGEYPHLSPGVCDVIALTPVSVAEAEPALQAASAGEAPGLARAFALAARQHDVQLAAAVTRLGAMSAFERLAHLLLEISDRLAAAGLSDGRLFPMPLTQEMLGDTLGLSIVHTNRTLQQFRREKMLELRSGVAVLLQKEALAQVAGCEPRPRRPPPPRASAWCRPRGLGDPAARLTGKGCQRHVREPGQPLPRPIYQGGDQGGLEAGATTLFLAAGRPGSSVLDLKFIGARQAALANFAVP